ncbi:MAG: response regulator [Bdellovibrionales bacterium]|nr:response regulator [Bdellovibrionales bacterium]
MEKRSVLLIEDDADLIEIEKYQLESTGYEVTTSQSVETAIDVLNKKVFDCILLDMNLHASSGRDIIFHVKAAQHINNLTPIIIVSGDLNIDLVKEIRDKIFTILVKPFDATDLNDKINAAISACKPQHEQHPTSTDKNSTVFIVDDDRQYLNELKRFLETESFTVIASTSSHEALNKLQNQRFDIILADLDIDQRNGEWLVNLVRKDSGHLNNKTPIIVISGYTYTGSPKLKKLVQQIVEKPVTFQKLFELIQDQLQHVQMQKQIVKSV